MIGKERKVIRVLPIGTSNGRREVITFLFTFELCDGGRQVTQFRCQLRYLYTKHGRIECAECSMVDSRVIDLIMHLLIEF